MEKIRDLRGRIQRKTANVYDTYFTRRLSIYFTVVLAPFATPNQVSVVGAMVGASACSLLAFAPAPWIWVGVGGVHLYAVLDSVDGELARLTKRFSLVGLFFEDLSAYVMINAMNLAVGYRLYAETLITWPLVGAVLVAAFGRNVMPVVRRAILRSVLTRRPAKTFPQDQSPTPQPKPRSRLREFIDENVLHATNQWVVLSLLLALFVEGHVSFYVVAAVYAGTLALFAIKELGALGLMLVDDRLERELARVYEAANQAPEHDGRKLSEFSAV